MNEYGYVRLHRKILNWEWFSEPATRDVFIYLFLTANHTDNKFMGKTIKRGQKAASENTICEALGFSRQQVRTAIKRLISTNEITKEKCLSFSLFTVVNYDEYQSDNQSSNLLLTNEQPTANQRVTTNKNEKNEKNDKKDILHFIPPTPDEAQAYCNEKGYTLVTGEEFCLFYGSKNWMVGKNKMSNWKSAIAGWNTRAMKDKPQDIKRRKLS